MSVTLKDIAIDTNVAKSTVSYVISGSGLNKVSKETRERILNSARKLDYHPNIGARGLSRGRSFMVGVIMQELVNSFRPDIIQGLENFLEENNYGLLLAGYKDAAELKRKCSYLWQRRVDGVVIFPDSSITDYSALDELAAKQVPIVSVTGRIGNTTAVLVNPESIGRLAASYLLERGHRRIAYAGPDDSLRIRGIHACIEKYPKAQCAVFGHCGNYDLRLGDDIFDWICSLPQKPTGVIVESDMSAVALIRTATKNGWHLPEELSVIGVDGLEIGRISLPALTSVGQPIFEQGIQAGQSILDAISGRNVGGHVFEPFIIERESCAVIDL